MERDRKEKKKEKLVNLPEKMERPVVVEASRRQRKVDGVGG